MAQDYQFRPDLKGVLRQGFAKGDPVPANATVPEIEKAKAVQAVERKSAKLREKARTHFEKMKPVWLEREIVRQKRANPLKASNGLAAGPTPPGGAPPRTQAYEKAMRLRAESLVNVRQQARLHGIEKAEARMVRQVMRTRTRSR